MSKYTTYDEHVSPIEIQDQPSAEFLDESRPIDKLDLFTAQEWWAYVFSQPNGQGKVLQLSITPEGRLAPPLDTIKKYWGNDSIESVRYKMPTEHSLVFFSNTFFRGASQRIFGTGYVLSVNLSLGAFSVNNP